MPDELIGTWTSDMACMSSLILAVNGRQHYALDRPKVGGFMLLDSGCRAEECLILCTLTLYIHFYDYLEDDLTKLSNSYICQSPRRDAQN